MFKEDRAAVKHRPSRYDVSVFNLIVRTNTDPLSLERDLNLSI